MRFPCPVVAPQNAAHLPRRLADGSIPVLQLKGGDLLTVNVSLALILGTAVILLCKYIGLRIWQAAVCTLFGFYLASSSLAPDISNIMTSIIRHL